MSVLLPWELLWRKYDQYVRFRIPFSVGNSTLNASTPYPSITISTLPPFIVTQTVIFYRLRKINTAIIRAIVPFPTTSRRPEEFFLCSILSWVEYDEASNPFTPVLLPFRPQAEHSIVTFDVDSLSVPEGFWRLHLSPGPVRWRRRLHSAAFWRTKVCAVPYCQIFGRNGRRSLHSESTCSFKRWNRKFVNEFPLQPLARTYLEAAPGRRIGSWCDYEKSHSRAALWDKPVEKLVVERLYRSTKKQVLGWLYLYLRPGVHIVLNLFFVTYKVLRGQTRNFLFIKMI